MHPSHEIFMRRCITLAQKGLGYTYPNPMVGAVVVINGKIIGEGWHQKAGSPHAEVNALKGLTEEQLAQATLYVSLEPCSHHGKTPPCSDLILTKGIKKVVVGAKDPNPKVAGQGIKRLQDAGVTVISDVLKQACITLNKRFYCFHTKKRPYIIVKWAQSADGYIAPRDDKKGDVFWISDAHSQQLAHRWRAEEHAILVGRKTVEHDNPTLTTRKWAGTNPIRMVLDPRNSISKKANVLHQDAQTIVFNTIKSENAQQTQWHKVNPNAILAQVLLWAHQNEIQSILVEGGAHTIEGFIEKNIWDECRIIQSKTKLNDGVKAPKEPLGKKMTQKLVGDQLQIILNEKQTLKI